MKNAFRLSGKKRIICVDFLSTADVQNQKSSPIPVITRWSSWLEAVIYHKEYFEYYPTMMKIFQNDFGDAVGVGELLSNEENYKTVKCQLHCLSIYGKRIIKYLKMVESELPVIHKI